MLTELERSECRTGAISVAELVPPTQVSHLHFSQNKEHKADYILIHFKAGTFQHKHVRLHFTDAFIKSFYIQSIGHLHLLPIGIEPMTLALLTQVFRLIVREYSSFSTHIFNKNST